MQSQSMILLAEIRHNEFQVEAARLQIVNQACAHRPMASEVIASARGRVRVALANAASRIRMQVHVQGVLATTRRNGSPAVSALSADTL
jgi:hypothetical protein